MKTIEKYFSGVVVKKGGKWYRQLTDERFASKDTPVDKIINVNARILLSPAVEICLDEDLIEREWRCFVIDNKLITANHLWTHELLKDENILDEIKNLIDQFDGKIPSCYCIDVMEYYDDKGEKTFDFVEFNPPAATGAELIPLVESVYDLPINDDFSASGRRQWLKNKRLMRQKNI